MTCRDTREPYGGSLQHSTVSPTQSQVRQYKVSDFPVVIRIFTAGCHGLTKSTFYNALTLPRNWLLLLAGFLLPLVTFGSILLAFLDVLVVLIVLWLFFHSLVREAQAKDLKDIWKYYLQQEGHNFWVAETNNEVVGMVAAARFYLPGREKHMELRRISVARNHRRKGIAKLLCGTMIEFAQKEGCQAVVLFTTPIQKDAIHLYKTMAFSFIHTSYLLKFTERLVNPEWIHFRYDIPSSPYLHHRSL
ncbi:probable N-acetyltransferase CML1 [Hyperolius riggenbachi]|uniref:probable N-acetyltransferase CML1 n=1 Tax=Hyperolius riggenbachi TaxID=752182 RepID=UPI0035A2D313